MKAPSQTGWLTGHAGWRAGPPEPLAVASRNPNYKRTDHSWVTRTNVSDSITLPPCCRCRRKRWEYLWNATWCFYPEHDPAAEQWARRYVDELVAAAPALLEEHESLDALARWFDRVADYAQVKRGVFAAVEVAVWRDLSAHSLGPIGDALTTLLDAGKADGTIRRDLIGYLSRLNDAEPDSRARHPLNIILDGLRSREHATLSDLRPPNSTPAEP
jgi:hypothetical protein